MIETKYTVSVFLRKKIVKRLFCFTEIEAQETIDLFRKRYPLHECHLIQVAEEVKETTHYENHNQFLKELARRRDLSRGTE